MISSLRRNLKESFYPLLRVPQASGVHGYSKSDELRIGAKQVKQDYLGRLCTLTASIDGRHEVELLCHKKKSMNLLRTRTTSDFFSISSLQEVYKNRTVSNLFSVSCLQEVLRIRTISDSSSVCRKFLKPELSLNPYQSHVCRKFLKGGESPGSRPASARRKPSGEEPKKVAAKPRPLSHDDRERQRRLQEKEARQAKDAKMRAAQGGVFNLFYSGRPISKLRKCTLRACESFYDGQDCKFGRFRLAPP